ncbi:DUF2512 family protein [Neobacillus sp. D3-1R]|uniref:DUF2512 family protein n=1 Tax=Neobacillus sp. D3-1R TaxID=3445778 RepID=UPI003FA081F7
MDITRIFIIKLVVSLLAFAIGLDLFFDASLAEIISFSLTTTVISLFIGDRMILTRLGNRNALVVDFFLTYISVWVFGSVVLNSYIQIAWGSIISATIITAAEVLVHRYIVKRTSVGTSNERTLGFNPKLAYGMEMAEEQDPKRK